MTEVCQPPITASAIGFIDKMIDYTTKNTPLPEPITAEDVGVTAAFLCSPLAAGITGAYTRVVLRLGG